MCIIYKTNGGILIFRGLLTILTATVLVGFNSQCCFADDADPPEVTIGERLFLETRFAQFFFTNSQGRVNVTLSTGDPVMDTTVTTQGSFPGPFAGSSMNCRACHLVDEQGLTTGGGNRTYADFARRSPIPARNDGKTLTPRNSPALVNSSLPRKGGPFFHFDGEFASLNDLVRGTFTGRNFGWLPGEQRQAIAHIAKVIREDDGSGDLAQDYDGLSYRQIFGGVTNVDLRLPAKYRINVDTASDNQILEAVARLVTAYVESLVFSQDESGAFNGSPYDAFLQTNSLPRQPDRGESNIDYARRLRSLLNTLGNPQYIASTDGTFAFHSQSFVFGAQELAGLKVFLAEPLTIPISTTNLANGSIGNCIACHAPPTFTDFHFHNTGVSQEEYDQIHGTNAFAGIVIPDAKTRRANFYAYLPPTSKHPAALGPFLAIPSTNQTAFADLGLWNTFDNPDLPRPQARLRQLLKSICDEKKCTRDELLPLTVGLFKTPGLRDLADSQPYLHTGAKDTLADVIQFYIDQSSLARASQLRNGDSRMQGVALTTNDIAGLAAFLESLTEDYH